MLDGRQLWLELTVAGTVMSPRLSVVSVPYALRAQTAAEAGRLGSLQPADVQVRVAGEARPLPRDPLPGHLAIVEAIVAGDGEAAATAMRAVVESAARDAEAVLARDPS